MKTRTLTISVLLLAMVLAPMALAADEPAPRGPRGGQGGPGAGRGGFRGGPGMGGDMMMERMIQQLNLTDAQQQKITAIQEESSPKMQETQQAVREAQVALQKAIQDGADDEIMAAGKAVGEALGKQGIVRAQTQRKINAVLTPEQQAKMKEMRETMRERMQNRQRGGDQGGRGAGSGRGPRGEGRRGPGRGQE